MARRVTISNLVASNTFIAAFDQACQLGREVEFVDMTMRAITAQDRAKDSPRKVRERQEAEDRRKRMYAARGIAL